jgi:hypothetical protein
MRAVLQRQLRPVQRAHPRRLARPREAQRPAQIVVIGQRERLVPQLPRPRRQRLRRGGPVAEGEGAVAVEFDGHAAIGYGTAAIGYRLSVD